MIGARHSKPLPAPEPEPSFVIGARRNDGPASTRRVAADPPRRDTIVIGATRSGQTVSR